MKWVLQPKMSPGVRHSGKVPMEMPVSICKLRWPGAPATTGNGRAWPAVWLCVLLAASLSACSDADDDPSPETADTPSDVVEAAVEPVDDADDSQELSTLDDLLLADLNVVTAPWRGDLPGMADRRFIRTLVVAGGPQFFYHEGKPRGIVAELLRLLEEEIDVALGRGLDDGVEIIPMPVSRDRLLPALISGEADLVAADLTITEGRSELVDFSAPFARNINEVIVFAPGRGGDVATLDDLAGQRIYVRQSSSFFEHLAELNETLASRGLDPVDIEEVNELLRSEDILEMVNAGILEATVIDSYKGAYWSEIFTDMILRADLVIHKGGNIAWAFRKDSPVLAAVVNDFIRGHREGTLIGNVLISRYFENLRWVRNSTSDSGLERLRALLEDFRTAGEANGIDPLMLAAQAYQESELDHEKVSPVGAVGIMQIKPSTAADPNVGIKDISDPSDNILAGARYMRFLIDRYFSDDGLTEMQRWSLALAAYNAGPARIRRLRKQAAAEGYDPNIWLDNVEVVAARKIGRETVNYVRNTFKYYVAYRLAWENQELRGSITE